MAAKRRPVRMCVCCRKRFYKPELTRYVKTGESVTEDPSHTLPGRGFYSCSGDECVKKMQKRLARL